MGDPMIELTTPKELEYIEQKGYLLLIFYLYCHNIKKIS